MNINFSDIGKQATAAFQHVASNGYKRYYNFEVDMSTMDDFNFTDIRKSPSPHEKLFSELTNIDGPVIYVFEIVTEREQRSKWLINALNEYKAIEGSKN